MKFDYHFPLKFYKGACYVVGILNAICDCTNTGYSGQVCDIPNVTPAPPNEICKIFPCQNNGKL